MSKIDGGRILLPLDGSQRSLETIRHLATMKPFQRYRMVLYHVFNSVPECYWDLSKEPKSVKTAVHVKAWEREQRETIGAMMNEARRILIQSGFDEESVKVVIQNRKQGIARDIIKQAHNNYTAVMIRRRGAGAIRSMIVGSVASKLIEHLTFAPLLIMGKQKPTGRILIAMDSSDGAMRALDFAAIHFGGHDYDVQLLHVIRGSGDVALKHPQLRTSQECHQMAIKTINTVFKEAHTRLIANGFSNNQISQSIITGAFSRAATIAKVAKEERFHTIVVGRRGLSRPRSFAIGRVSSKVIHMARGLSVWVIN
jgi:nucleotide-binding universal stress UspA family protein